MEIKRTSFGNVGKVFSGHGIEAVWVSKQDEGSILSGSPNRQWISLLSFKASYE